MLARPCVRGHLPPCVSFLSGPYGLPAGPLCASRRAADPQPRYGKWMVSVLPQDKRSERKQRNPSRGLQEEKASDLVC